MNWTTFLIPVAFVTGFAVFRRAGQISSRKAAELVRNGALILDVRTAKEFRDGHIARAVNIPHDAIERLIARQVPDKTSVLLLHCQSGMRSAIARRKLVSMGYTNTFDLGSYSRAMHIADQLAPARMPSLPRIG
jgi:phage shock protein E